MGPFTQRVFYSSPPPIPKRPRLSIEVIGMVILGTLAAAGLLHANSQSRLSKLRREMDDRFEAAQKAHEHELQEQAELEAKADAEEQAAYLARLNDFKTGDAARERHEREWARRLSHDSTLAKSPMEKTLLRMELLGKDPSVAAGDALKQVALLAAPSGSRVEVDPQGDQYVVKVAFKMSAMTSQESGAVTKHHTTAAMKREVQDISAGLMQTLFDYCGTRGIAKLQVSCNHALRQIVDLPGITEAERQALFAKAPVTMDKLYRVSLEQGQAQSIPDWRRAPRSQVARMMNVEYDGFGTLTITGTTPFTSQPDPDVPLQF